MNHGLLGAVTYDKYALFKLQELEEEESVNIYPIVGVGSAPFRGHLVPENVENVLEEYRGAQTFTIQSSFKYDNPPREVIKAVEKIKSSKRKEAEPIDEQILSILRKYEIEYSKQIKALASSIREVAKFVPLGERESSTLGYLVMLGMLMALHFQEQ